jgi:long-chain fatty acid transport protein
VSVLLALAFSGHATASGFALMEQNASGIGASFAGSAAIADNASTLFFNPAGMTKLADHELSTGVAAVKPSYKFSDGGSTATLGTSTGDAGGWAAVPNGYLSWAINPDLRVGVGVGAPFGLKTEYSPTWVGQFQSTKFEIKTYNINPSIAYRVTDKVSLGFGVNWQYMSAEYQRQAAMLNALTQSTHLTMNVHDDQWGWNAGALIDLTPATRLGISYRSSIKHTLKGSLSSTNQLVSPDVSAQADITLPDMLIASATHTVNERWTLLGDLSWTGWSSVQNVDIVRTSGTATGTTAQTLEAVFRDTWRVALGGIYKYNGDWDLKCGIAYDQSPVRSDQQRLVSLPDNNRFWLSAGARWKVSPASHLDFGVARLFVQDTSIDNNQILKSRGRVTGTYDSSVWILGAQYSRAF